MANFNKVILAGNLTRDPEVRYTPKGTAIAKLGMAINRTWKTETGETKEEVTFVDIDAFGRTAEVISQYLKNGATLLKILGDYFGCPAKGVYVNKGDFFLGFAGLGFPGAIDGHAEFGNRGAFWGVAHFGIAGEIAGEDYFVEVSHSGSLLLLRCGRFRSGGVGEEHAKDFIIHGEAVLQLVKRRGLALENDVHVKTGAVLFVRDAAEIAFVHLL